MNNCQKSLSGQHSYFDGACLNCGLEEPVCRGFHLTKEEVKYLVDNIQNEYLNKETYHFASELFNRMEKFLK